jgi:hypothetical protein
MMLIKSATVVQSYDWLASIGIGRADASRCTPIHGPLLLGIEISQATVAKVHGAATPLPTFVDLAERRPGGASARSGRLHRGDGYVRRGLSVI